LKASGWCSIELGPVELLLNAVKGFITDLAPRAQPVQCRALGSDRVEPQFGGFNISASADTTLPDCLRGSRLCRL
jgi:hypothetical protein